MVRTAFVSTYPPRKCGIAAFTAELARVTPDREIVALHPREPIAAYAFEVHHRIRRDERSDYARTAHSLERCADVVSIQFDPAIWGGEDGEWVLDLVSALQRPAIVTLHALPRNPTPRQRDILVGLIASVRAVVVTSTAAAVHLARVDGIGGTPIEVIPYGIPDLPAVAPESIKPKLDLEGRPVILSGGLLRPDKGFERMIDALPAVLAAHPTAIYAIVGATHPDVARTDGDAYRQRLVERAQALGVTRNVRFVPEFLGRIDLTRWLQAADVFVIPTSDTGKMVSGTLAHAMAAGRPIVSTRFPYAAELLAEGRGALVTGAPASLAASVIRLLDDPRLRARMGARAHEYSRAMSWTRVGTDYQQLFNRVATGVPLARGGSPRPVATATQLVS